MKFEFLNFFKIIFIIKGNVTLAKKLQKNENINFIHFRLACNYNRLSLLIWLCEIEQSNQINFDKLLLTAAINNSLKVVKWILKNKPIEDINTVFIEILKYGDMKPIKLIYYRNRKKR